MPPNGMGLLSGIRKRPRTVPVVEMRTTASTVETPVGIVSELRPPRPNESRTSMETAPSKTPGNSITPWLEGATTPSNTRLGKAPSRSVTYACATG